MPASTGTTHSHEVGFSSSGGSSRAAERFLSPRKANELAVHSQMRSPLLGWWVPTGGCVTGHFPQWRHGQDRTFGNNDGVNKTDKTKRLGSPLSALFNGRWKNLNKTCQLVPQTPQRRRCKCHSHQVPSSYLAWEQRVWASGTAGSDGQREQWLSLPGCSWKGVKAG